ncbi:SIR2 family NAD-dependent protein deacylase [Paraburkholderia caballeronis]|uniref:SIR2-like domain-containing protein n=1 Tax=Paraburkholderia caballeronis TaxID=416943 RepID=A0A1H7F6R2_9BURK|nr:SIR2 family protein [Paraburkholderia caballeronis]PXW23997.1 SIR2-like protein [Paraburkholderia caballeronis]PXW99761.1 SIR2-like protein [Paraburkholderia caballeronis]RAJ96715.1 SIR2-like protein [Paraburkholderia caballeronis]SEE76255.1 SIR2-like domain-containing protein [Paraburkholderia caballeronis]SEK21746.1 SIR2-like domain-containing protein [Paraburkholderia caballeronis]
MSVPVSIDHIARRIDDGSVVPYLGPGMLALCPDARVPATPDALARIMTARVSVPHKIRHRLTQAAQFIENFKHRKSVVGILDEAFGPTPTPSALHRALAASGAGLYVDCWYDDTFAAALAGARPGGQWAQVQGLSQSEHFGQWFGAYDAAGAPLDAVPAGGALLYKPIGAHAPASNYLVSDSDYVEVLTEIDIQTPIPPAVQAWRSGRSFLFVGCRFDDQLARSFARQIMKRSSDAHWAVLPDEPTRMEARFLAEQRITRIPMPLATFADELVSALQPALAA